MMIFMEKKDGKGKVDQKAKEIAELMKQKGLDPFVNDENGTVIINSTAGGLLSKKERDSLAKKIRAMRFVESVAA